MFIRHHILAPSAYGGGVRCLLPGCSVVVGLCPWVCMIALAASVPCCWPSNRARNARSKSARSSWHIPRQKGSAWHCVACATRARSSYGRRGVFCHGRMGVVLQASRGYTADTFVAFNHPPHLCVGLIKSTALHQPSRSLKIAALIWPAVFNV